MGKRDLETPIEELRNFGPAGVCDLHAIEVFTPGDIIELVVEQTFELLVGPDRGWGWPHVFQRGLPIRNLWCGSRY